MDSSTPKYLRVAREEPQPSRAPDPSAISGWRQLSRSFLELTGYLLRFLPHETARSANEIPVPVPQCVAGDSAASRESRPTLGLLRLDAAEPTRQDAPIPPPVRRFAESIAEMLGELLSVQTALWEREAELATAIPLVPHVAEEKHLAERLTEVLRAAAESISAQAAALYLLDEGTTELKLRAAWGLPPGRLAAPPRPLKTALADLEAMLGHAVVLENTRDLTRWQPPEPAASAVCLPIAGPTTILGTLWIFCNQPRSFSERHTDLLEVAAGRITAELERQVALQTALEAAGLRKQLESARRLQRSQLPAVAPLLDDWEFAGWTESGDDLAGSFHDWSCGNDGRVLIVLGDAAANGVEAAIAAAALRTAVRSLADRQRDAGKLLERVNLTLWTGSAGDQKASLFCGLLDPRQGSLRASAAGSVHGLLLGGKRARICSGETSLGIDPETRFPQYRWTIPAGGLVLVCNAAVRRAKDESERPLWETRLLPMLPGLARHSAKQAAERLRDAWEQSAVDEGRGSASLLIIRRLGRGSATA
ncbi:PP2C family protein-serine/threonine phosphatase [Thermopirellula anaerolimosa]